MANTDSLQLNNAASASFTQQELLRYVLERDNLSLDGVVEDYMRQRKESIIKEHHPFAITKSKDGRYRTYIKDGSGRKQIVRVSESDLKDFLVNHYAGMQPKSAKTSNTLASLYKEWIEYKRVHVEHTTVERIQRDWKRYYAGEEIIKIPLKKLDKLTVDRWVHEIILRYKLNNHSYGNFSLILRQMLDYAVDKGIITENVFNQVKVDRKRRLVREEKKPDHTQVFSAEEQEKLFELAWRDYYSRRYRVNHMTPLVVMFMFLTGTRIGEACAIKHIDIQKGVLTVRRMVRVEGDIIDKTKGTYGERKILLVPEALRIIQEAKDHQIENDVDSEYLFSMSDKPITRDSVAKAFYKYCEELGIEKRSSHKARKTFVSSLLDAGVNLNTVRQLVGHVDERTTLNNYCFDRSSDDEIVAQMEAALS